VDEIASPLINRSQETCGIPIDNIPPCAPELTITNICDDPNPNPNLAFENNLLWTNPNDQCPDTDDVVEYEIFYTPIEGGEFASINTQGPADNSTFTHTPNDGIAGCYFVVAIDSVGNQSEQSNIVCVDNCPLYELPNAFTPNGDSANDLFVPFPYRFIESIDIKIYNQWGNLVHQNTDPDINWDGTNENNEILSDGVYFYVCRVFERRVRGVVESPERLEGFIELRKGR
jgi:gliding motility-associated-like protein